MVSNIDPSTVSTIMAKEEKNLKVLYFKLGKLYTEKNSAPRQEISAQVFAASKKLTSGIAAADEEYKKKLTRIYIELGKQYVTNVTLPDDYMKELFDSVKKTEGKIRSCRKFLEISDTQKAQNKPEAEAPVYVPATEIVSLACPHCGSKKLKENDIFCGACGKPVKASAVMPKSRCAFCGNTDVIAEDVFCIKCGKML